MPPISTDRISPTGQRIQPAHDYEAQFKAALTAATLNYAAVLVAGVTNEQDRTNLITATHLAMKEGAQ